MDKRKQIEEKVKQILADKLEIGKERIHNNSLLMDDLGMDSFSAIEVAYSLVEHFNLEIQEKDFAEVKNPNDIFNFIYERKYGKK